jgi:fatty acid desaturase
VSAPAAERIKPRSYYKASGALNERLGRALDGGELAQLHRLSAPRHFAVALRHVLFSVACAWGAWTFANPWIWVPLAALQGINILGFIILLHEVQHGLVFDRPRAAPERWLGLLYALPSTISPSQYGRWHLDHHAELGSSADDPKRAYLTPKIVRRWYKLLYCTPMLFVIYGRASAREAASYPADLRRRIRAERAAAILAHVVVAGLRLALDPAAMLRAYAVPLFFAFPVAFTINRLGQHYDIDPARIDAWSTLVNGNAVVRFLFLASNHHIEHHYFPGVPLYRLAKLNRRLQPHFSAAGIESRTYGGLLYDWFVLNKEPHTSWSAKVASPAAPPAHCAAHTQ